MFTGTGIHWNESKAEQRISNSSLQISLEETPLLIAEALVNIPGSAPLLMWGLNWNVTFGYVTKSLERDTCFSRHLLLPQDCCYNVNIQNSCMFPVPCLSTPPPRPQADPKGQDQEWNTNSFQIVLKLCVSSLQMRGKWAKWNKWGRSTDVAVIPLYLCILDKPCSFLAIVTI